MTVVGKTRPQKGNTVRVDGAPDIPGLRFRTFRDEGDFPAMSRIAQTSLQSDGVEWVTTADELKEEFSRVRDRDPYSDVLFVEARGEMIGYSQMTWDNEPEDVKVYRHIVHLVEEWKGKGIREALLRRNETLLRNIASAHSFPKEKYIQLWAFDGPNDWKRLVEQNRYSPVWRLLEMRHRTLDGVVQRDLPRGLVLRPPRKEELRRIWDLYVRCFKGEPWFTAATWNDEAFSSWMGSPILQPELINVAWDGDDPVGVVEMRISEDESERIGRKIAHAWAVCVDERWRGQGVAKSLLASGLAQVRDLGMNEVTLDTEVENRFKAMNVYAGVGFEVDRTFTFYRKPIAAV